MAIRIDRLALRLSGISPGDAPRLARRIAEELAVGEWATGRRDVVRLKVAARPGEETDRLAAQIAAAVLQELNRTLP